MHGRVLHDEVMIVVLMEGMVVICIVRGQLKVFGSKGGETTWGILNNLRQWVKEAVLILLRSAAAIAALWATLRNYFRFSERLSTTRSILIRAASIMSSH